MKILEAKSAARAMTLTALHDVLEQLAAVQFGDASFAVLQEVDGQEVWTEITVKSKSFTETAKGGVFDPFVEAEAWKEEKAAKAAKAEAKAKEKAAKIAADKARRAAKAAKAQAEEEEEKDDPNQYLDREVAV